MTEMLLSPTLVCVNIHYEFTINFMTVVPMVVQIGMTLCTHSECILYL